MAEIHAKALVRFALCPQMFKNMANVVKEHRVVHWFISTQASQNKSTSNLKVKNLF